MRRLTCVIVCFGAFIGCSRESAVGPPSVAPQASISDASHNGGNPHFFFLPPLVPAPSTTGWFDAGLAPTVRICEWTGSVCATELATYSIISGPGSERIRLDAAAQQYLVNWHTDQFALDPAKTYRISVLVAGTELGHADVDVVSTGRELRNVQSGEYVGLVDGRTLPIKFRIEVGAVTVVGSAGATVSAGDGDVTLTVPAGALPADVGITVGPVGEVPPQVTTVPGTAWEFGPDGLVFDTPVTLAIRYDPAALGAIVEHRLRLHKIRGGGLVEVPGSTVDTAANVVSGQISGFSDYVVGPGGGLTWSLVPSAPTGVNGLFGFANDDVVAVTRHGEVWRYDGTGWSHQATPAQYLASVWGADPSNIFAIGGGANGAESVHRFDGSQWTRIYGGTLAYPGFANDFLIADVTGDGRNDIVAADRTGIGVLPGDGAGGFGSMVHSAVTDCCERLLSANLDGDGIADLVVATSSGIATLRGTGAGGFTPVGAAATGYIASLAVGDLNGDGRDDVLVGPWNATAASVFLNTGSGGLSAAASVPIGVKVDVLRVADFDRDGNLDLATIERWGHPAITVRFGDGSGGFPGRVDLAAVPAVNDIVTGDLDRDGNPDIAAVILLDPYGGTGPRNVDVHYGDGAGGFAAPVTVASPPDAERLTAADVNGDSGPDLLTTSSADVSQVILGGGGRSYLPPRLFGGGDQHGLRVGDVNGDGLPDALTAVSSMSTDFRMHVNLGGGAFLSLADLTAVWGTSASNVYVSFGGGILRYDGSTWSQVFEGGTGCWVEGIWGSSPSDVFAVGGDCVMHYNGSVWTPLPVPGQHNNLTGIWGSGPADVYAIGRAGASLLHYDGGSWSSVAYPGAGDSGGDLVAIWGSSSVDVYVLVDWGYAAVLRYNGTSWQYQFNDPTTLSVDLELNGGHRMGIWGSSADSVWVGAGGGIVHGVR
jgi:hypothetical protein